MVDQATLEMMVSIVVDENEATERSAQRIFEYKSCLELDEEDKYLQYERLVFEENWQSIDEAKDNSVFVTNHPVVEGVLWLTISKNTGCFLLEISGK